MAKVNNYVVIRTSGRAMSFEGHTYMSLLLTLDQERATAGCNYDLPKLLIHNGEVVVAEKLYEVAANYRDDYERSHKQVRQSLQERWLPEWEKSE